MGLIDMALATFNYSKICYNYSIYSDINREVNKDVNKKEIYNVLIFQCFKVCHVSSTIIYRAQFFLNQLSIGPLSRTARPVAQAKSSITTSAKLRLPATHKTYHLYKFSR
jgi:hypothetical protein